MTKLSSASRNVHWLLHDLPDNLDMAGLEPIKKTMKTKTILCGALAVGLLAGCASEKSEQTKQARLEAKAKIARADAKNRPATGAQWHVKEAEIEKEHGRLIWSFDIAVPDSKNIKEVAVDALTGQVVAVETERRNSKRRKTINTKSRPGRRRRTMPSAVLG